MVAKPDNVKGFYEPEAIVNIHDRLLASAGSFWSDWKPFPVAWADSVEGRAFESELRTAIQEDFNGTPLFVLKDPRICRFPFLWFRIFSEMHIAPFVVLPFRNPVEVAQSLHIRDGFSTPHVYLVWLRHVLDAEFGSRGHPRVFLSYEAFVENTDRELNRLARELPPLSGLQPEAGGREIGVSIRSDLRHNRVTLEEATECADVFSWMFDAYDAYLRLCIEPADEEAQQKLDLVRSQFNTACQAFAPLVGSLQALISDRTRDGDLVRDRVRSLEDEVSRRYQTEQDLSMALERASKFEQIASRMPYIEEALATERRQLQQLREEHVSKVASLDQLLHCALTERDELSRQSIEQAVVSEQVRSTAKAELALLRSFLLDREKDKRRPSLLLARLCRIAGFFLPDRIHREHALRRRMEIVKESGLFDSLWYATAYPDVVVAGLDPLRHFCEFGIFEGRSPAHELFDGVLPLQNRPVVCVYGRSVKPGA
jgi:hypothetical protein